MIDSGVFFRHRDAAAGFSALLVGAFLVVGQAMLVILPAQKNREAPIRVSLKEEPPKPELPKPQPKPVQQKVPVRKVVVPVQKPVVETPKPVATPHVVSVPTPAQQVAPTPTPAPVRQARIASNGASEADFARSVRQKIESHKVYPAEAQSLGMTGSVTLRYVIDRSGKLLEVDVVSSSGSKLLDQAAVQAVRKTSFQPIPEDAWVGEARKEFRTTMVFEIDG